MLRAKGEFHATLALRSGSTIDIGPGCCYPAGMRHPIPDPSSCLASGPVVDSDAFEVRQFAARALSCVGSESSEARTIALYYAVRDGLRYDPYSFSVDPVTFKASHVAAQTVSWCVPKAILLTAALRAADIPAAVGFADVRNHLTTPKLRERMGTDSFINHGYTAVWLHERWIKITPAFNAALCERFGVHPLEFDGKSDALFHEFDRENRRHMEYVADHGFVAEPDLDALIAEYRAAYPRLVAVAAGAASKDEAFQG
ncbi:MAG TPA: transglutaminase family protein [Hyphomicrobiaceae bacterium]|nr:transglutaminase family protein [Hyphomicrobiaceae bacterium]